MRIYLDSNVFRDLAKPGQEELAALILADKEWNIYPFSEAHIQDLVQDSTDRKLADLEFMATIVGEHGWFHADQQMRTRWSTPRAYYDAHEWNTGTDILTSTEGLPTMIRGLFRSIPLHWDQLIDPTQLPADFPPELREIMLKPATMLDFMAAMLDWTEALSEDQANFKRLLQYLHKSMHGQALFKQLGIEGYDGREVTDWPQFSTSFQQLVWKSTVQKDLYSIIIQAVSGLDFYGIVKGKPKKQKFASLRNDGKHIYYAAHAHILVTSDVDMIARARMIFRIWNWSTQVLTPLEFLEWLKIQQTRDRSVGAMFSEFDRMADLPTLFEAFTLDEMHVRKELPEWYLGVFNTVSCITKQGTTFYCFHPFFTKIPTGTLVAELERVIDRLLDHFGPDEHQRGRLNRAELTEESWIGREWRAGEMSLILNNQDALNLFVFKAAPKIEELERSEQPAE